MNKIILSILVVVLAGCGKPKKAESVPQEKNTSVGPFDLVLSGEAESKQNAFSASIAQEDGAVDFYLPNGDSAQYLEITSMSSTVTGCNASGVKVTPVWYASESLPRGETMNVGSTLMTTPKTRSLLRVAFQGMKGCSQLNFGMVVRKFEIGLPQPVIEPMLRGFWEYTAPGGVMIDLITDSVRMGWLEGRGSSITCDTSFYPSSAPFSDGGWLVFSGARMLCKYQFTNSIKTEMNMVCHGTNTFGCTLPKNLHFVKR